MDVRTVLAAQKYTASKPATGPGEAGNSVIDFAKDFASTLNESEKVSMQAMTSNADPHTLVQALAQTELAVETAVTVRNKVVEAYQEILRMPV